MRRLIAEKARLEVLARTGAWGPAVAEGPTLHPGDERPAGGGAAGAAGAARLRRADGRGGRRPASTTAWPQAVAQRSSATTASTTTAWSGAMTLAAMNAPIETRLAQVLVNLERMRWMNGDAGAARISLVNIPDFTVTLYEDGAARLELEGGGRQDPRHRDAGVRRRGEDRGGQPDLAHPGLDRDPRLPAEAAEEPDGAEEPGHRPDDAARDGDQPQARRLHPVHAGELPVPHQAAAERRQCARRGEVPVPEPAFGLHARHAAQASSSPRDVRAFSNGCIRLEKPVELAHILLAGQSADPAATYAGLRASGKERRGRRWSGRSRCISSTAPSPSTTPATRATGRTSTAGTRGSSRRWRRRG